MAYSERDSMCNILRMGLYEFEVKAWHEVRRNDVTAVFHDVLSARDFLGRVNQGRFTMMTLRDALARGHFNMQIYRLTDDELIDHVARLLSSGEIRIILLSEPRRVTSAGLSRGVAKEVEEPIPIQPATESPQREKKANYTLTVLIPLDDIFLEAVEDDEALLESTDGAYRNTLKVYEEGEKIDEEYIRLVFHEVVPDKKYTLIYDTKEDDEGTEVAKVIMFHSKLIGTAELENPLKLAFPFEESKDF